MRRLLKNSLIHLAGLALVVSVMAFIPAPVGEGKSAGNASDSLGSPSFIRNTVKYSRNYSFIRYDRNYVEWQDPSSLSNFFNKLKNSQNQKVKVLHIGDSHIQADIFTGAIRERLQEIFGYGGRGIVFPYSAAKTHSAYDYRTWKTGDWNYARNVNREPELELGISGVTIQTADKNASFGINFVAGSIRENFRSVKVYCKKSPQSFNLLFKYAADAEPVLIDCRTEDGKPYAEVRIPKNSNDFEFSVVQSDTAQKFFECYGIQIENAENSGILYNSVGINGAGLKSILKSTRFASQVADMKPDLMVLDLGANDFYGGYYNEEELAKDLESIIQIVKFSSPNTSLIVSCSQDIFRKRKNVGECSNYSSLTKNVAFANDLAHYNYFQISGGRYSMLKWQTHGLSKKDRVHLSNDGYNLKGELFANALLNSYYRFLLSDGKRSLVVNDVMSDTSAYGNRQAVIEETPAPGGAPENEKQPLKPTAIDEFKTARVKKTVKKLTIHKVKKGETLGLIAGKYSASVSEIKKWNRIKGNSIRSGQKLKIYREQTLYVAKAAAPRKAPREKAAPSVVKKQTQAVAATGGKNVHTVQKGESLFAIAKKYNTTVENIKSLNGLRTDAIKPGQKIRVK